MYNFKKIFVSYFSKIWLILVFIVFNYLGSKAYGQMDTEFWFVVPEITIDHHHPGGVPASFNFISGSLPATVTISMPAGDPLIFPDIVFHMSPFSSTEIDVSCWIVAPCNPPFTPSPGYFDIDLLENKALNASGINNFGVLITSTAPINAFYAVKRNNNKDIWTLKGRNALGIEFFTPFQTNRENSNAPTPTKPYSAIDIVATEDFTEVTFSLPPGIAASYGKNSQTNIAAGGTFSKILHKGQTFSLFPIDYSRLPTDRLIGAKIASSSPIAVTLNDDSFFHTVGGAYDVAGDQLIPTNLIGNEYVILRTDLYTNVTDNKHDHIYILGTENETSVNVYDTNGNEVINFSLNSRQQEYIRIPVPEIFYRVVSNKPVYVWHNGGFGQEIGGAIVPNLDGCTGSTKVNFSRLTVKLSTSLF